MSAVLKMLVRIALREEDRERKKGLRPIRSTQYWDEAFNVWRDMVLKKRC